MMANNQNIEISYLNWINELKHKIAEGRHKAALSLNSSLIELYWHIGQEITLKEKLAQWGSGFMERLSRDLTDTFPDMKGFSKRNLYAIRQWYLFYSAQFQIVPQPVAQIPWGHNRLIIAKTKNIDEALWYAAATISNGWARDILEIKIQKNEYERQGRSLSNFPKVLSDPLSALAQETLKDPYNFDFLGLEDDAQEREIEHALTQKLTDFLLELGKGFAYIGRQYKLAVNENEYFLDMLFYHLNLRCFIVVELKAGKFKPEYAGKLNFYLSAVDSQLKKSDDNPSIGLLLCKSKDALDVEYSLRDINKPIGVSEYHLTQAIPAKLSLNLPTVEELENELASRLQTIEDLGNTDDDK